MLFCVDAELELGTLDLAEVEAAVCRRARDAHRNADATLTVTVAARTGEEAVAAARALLAQVLGGAGAVRCVRRSVR